MRYVVVESFSDMQDSGYTYKPGDAFPRGGISVGNSRLVELSTAKNKLGRALIKKVEVETAAPVTGTKSGVAVETDEPIKAADVVDVPPQDPSESESKPRRGRKKKN